MFHNIGDECVEHENNENSNEDVINCTYVTDLQQLPVPIVNNNINTLSYQ